MKKFIRSRLLAVFASAVVCCGALGLAACGDDDDSDIFKAEKIGSATEWAAAMDFSDVTNGTLQISGMDGRIQTGYFDGDKIKKELTNRDGTESSIRYIEYRPNEPHEDSDSGTEYCYKYNVITSTWVIEKYGMHDRDTLADLFTDGVDDNLMEYNEATDRYEKKLSERYSDFDFDESKHAYVVSYARLGEMSNVNVEVKFKDGKLIEGSFTCVYEYGGQTENMEIMFKIYDVGTTQVNLPQVDEN